MNATPNSQTYPKPFLQRHAITIKLLGVLFLVLILLIPLGMIGSILRERWNRRNEAVSGITSTWGSEQTITGPVLIVPFQYRYKTWQERTVDGKVEKVEVEKTAVANAYFLPDDLTIGGSVTPKILHRGIYDAVVYSSSLEISGRFPEADFAELGVPEEDFLWEKASVTLAVSDLRGTGKMIEIEIGQQKYLFTPGCKMPDYPSGVAARVPDLRDRRANLDFRMVLDIKGSGSLHFAPFGRENRVNLTSSWSAPSFNGAFLPTQRTVGPAGFDANWEISWYGRNYPQQSTDRNGYRALNPNNVYTSLFGVAFLPPVDSYRMVERSTKYAVLFIALVFTAFFLFEVLASLRIHNIQYLLVGGALCLFYLAVLSLSEFLAFGYAYWIGAAASALLIVLYSLAVLRSGMRTGIVAAALATIYTYLYVVLQLQNYSLLIGTAGLFIALGIVMYTTRNLDWSTRES